jgi:hypothetical protein
LGFLPRSYGIHQPQWLPTSSISGLLLITLPLLLLLMKDY